MDEILFDKTVSFLSNHFELIVSLNLSLLAVYILFLIAIRLSNVSILKLLHSAARRILYTIIVVGQFTLFVMIGYLYWQNYQKPAPEFKFGQDLLASTQWVKNDTRIYFIDGLALRSVKINGQDKQDVFAGNDPIKEYHFSPDGTYLIVLTQRELFLLDRETKQSQRIDTLVSSSLSSERGEAEMTQGGISGIQWAPDSQKFVYEIARWSPFSVQDNVYLYTVADQKKRMIQSPTRHISSLYWDQQGNNLYYLHHEAKDTSLHVNAFEVRVFRIPLTTLVPELVIQIPFEKSSVPIDNLRVRGIDLFLEGDKFSFGRPGRESYLISEEGSSVGIDEDDYLYFIRMKWFRKRLYRIPRQPDADDARYQYKGGRLVVDHIRWIPGGRYVIMEHKQWGVLIVEPSTNRAGLLIRARGHTFGWYQA